MTVIRDAEVEGKSYLQILKSTLVIGGSSVVNVGFSIIRNKAVAIILGPEGTGLLGLYGSIADIAQAVASLGIQSSGVRQIADAVGTGDNERIARTATVLNRVSWLLGLIGALALIALALPIADLTFGGHEHAVGVALLSMAVFLRIVSAGQVALLQAMRHITSLAVINVLAAFFSTVITIPLIYYFGVQGIVPSLVAVAAATLLASWWYSSKSRMAAPTISLRAYSQEVAALLKLGFVFMASGILTFGAAYAIRLIVTQAEGVGAAGLYQAAWSIGGLYAGFILQAMGTDFYPRLTAASQDNEACNRLVNEQAQVSILLAGPGVIATLTFAPVVMQLFYSAEFHSATEMLRWICLGMMLRIIAWPVGFIVVAKGAQAIFFWTDVAATAVHVGLAWLLVAKFGAVGAGAAFFGLYFWHSILIYAIIRHMTGFRWSALNVRLGVIFLGSSGAVFAATQLLPFWLATAFGAGAVVLSGLYSLRMLAGLVPHASLPRPIRAWVTKSVSAPEN